MQDRQIRIKKYQAITKEKLLNFKKDDLKDYLGNLWAKRGVRKSIDKIIDELILKNKSISNICNQLCDLLYGNDNIIKRWDNFKLKGLGNAYKSELLTLVYPTEYALYNSTSVSVLEYLDIGESYRNKNSITGADFAKFCDDCKTLRTELLNKECQCENLLGVDFFFWEISQWNNSTKKQKIKDTIQVAKSNNNLIKIHFKRKGVKAKGVYNLDNKHVTIFAGSYINSNKTFAFSSTYEKLRQDLIDGGYIDEQNCVFLKDFEFDYPTPAASILSYSTSSGYTDFYTDDTNQSLTDYLSQRQQITQDITDKIDENNDYIQNISQNYNDYFQHKNTIVYGVPGSGKSYKIKEIIKGLGENNYIRVIFHPEYTYSDFIGMIRPNSKNNSNNMYSFYPGPFTEILKKALSDKEHEYCLIIEEMNRGNAPAIFGDIFQLLDRDKYGKSEYDIYNKEIQDYLEDCCSIYLDKIYIPSNLSIVATMNTADQSVFVLDTAFKRRWNMFPDWKFNINTDTQDAKEIWSGAIITWGEFRNKINNIIRDNYVNDIFEDKTMGVYFVKDFEFTKDVFPYKVISYLWQDVCKFDKESMFNTSDYKTLEDAIKGFSDKKEIFKNITIFKTEEKDEQNQDNKK